MSLCTCIIISFIILFVFVVYYSIRSFEVQWQYTHSSNNEDGCSELQNVSKENYYIKQRK